MPTVQKKRPQRRVPLAKKIPTINFSKDGPNCMVIKLARSPESGVDWAIGGMDWGKDDPDQLVQHSKSRETCETEAGVIQYFTECIQELKRRDNAK